MNSPFFSVVTPVYNPPLGVLREMIASVRDQDEQDWELILVDDCSPDAAVRDVLRAAAVEDSRIRVIERDVNGHIVAASNDGVALASGRFLVMVDHDDLIVPKALSTVRAVLDADPEIDYLYSDEDKVDVDGNFYDAFRKPDWSPERLRSHNYTSHLSVMRTSLVREVGGFHTGFDGSQDHDLELRVTERARKVAHVPEVLYHWRVVPGSAAGDSDAKPYAWTAGRDAVQAHVDRTGLRARVEYGSITGTYRLRREPWREVRVSVVIPTRGDSGIVWGSRRCFVVEAVRSVIALGGHDDLEIVVVYDEVTPSQVLDELRAIAGDRLVLVPYLRPFNFSEKCNLGVVHSTGQVVVLLNDDVELRSDGAIADAVAPLREPDVGVTGARLLYSDSTIQHGGLACYGRHLVHAFLRAPDEDPGPFAALRVSRECSAVTGAFLAVRREVYDQVGGLCEQLPVNFNDVDFCLKVGRSGFRLLWLADVAAYHFESKSRVPTVAAWEQEFILNRWHLPKKDPYTYGRWHG